MKNILLLMMAMMALEASAKGKIVGALDGTNRKLGVSDLSRIYGTLKDEELIPELVELRNGKGRLSRENFERAYAYGLDKELVERAKKSEPLQNELLSRIEDKKTPAEIRWSAVRHIWKFRSKPDQVEGDEALLRRVHTDNPEDPELRIESLKRLNTSSDSNIEFLVGVVRNAKDESELGAAVNKLGKIGLKAEKEGRKGQEARIRKELIGLRESGRLDLAQLSSARCFSDTKEGRRYLLDELSKAGFRGWQQVLYSVGPSSGYENLRRAYKKVKSENSIERDRDVLKQLAKGTIEGFKDGEGLKDSESKKDFLELRAMLLDAPVAPAADSATADLLHDKDASVRMQAVIAVHYGLKENYRLLSAHYAREKDEGILDFLRGHGYAE